MGLEGWTQTSIVISLELITELLTLVAAAADSIIVPELMFNPPELQDVLEVLAIVRFKAVPTPETSLTVEPLPSLKSYKTCRPVVILLQLLPPGGLFELLHSEPSLKLVST